MNKITLKLNNNGGKLNMVNERVAAALKILKEEGVETNVVTDDEEESEMKGTVGGDEDEAEESASSNIIEAAEAGRGYQIYADYNNSTKFKRLCR